MTKTSTPIGTPIPRNTLQLVPAEHTAFEDVGICGTTTAVGDDIAELETELIVAVIGEDKIAVCEGEVEVNRLVVD